jgi:hypothetical protein
MWIWKRRPPRGELLYYVIAIPCALILLSALTFATRGVGFTPDLRAHILFASLLPQNEVPSYLPHSGAIGMMIVHISNLGTPTSVDDYSVTAEADGQTFTGRPFTFNTFAGTIGKFRIGFEWSSSSLYMKTRRPIRTGDSVGGVLLFQFDNVMAIAIDRPGTRYCLDFQDVASHEYEQCVVQPAQYSEEPEMDPDLDMSVERIAP